MSTWFAPNFRLLFTPFENKIQSFSQPIPKLHAVHWQHMVIGDHNLGRIYQPTAAAGGSSHLYSPLSGRCPRPPPSSCDWYQHPRTAARTLDYGFFCAPSDPEQYDKGFSQKHHCRVACRQLVNGIIPCFLQEKDKCLRKLCASMSKMKNSCHLLMASLGPRPGYMKSIVN